MCPLFHLYGIGNPGIWGLRFRAGGVKYDLMKIEFSPRQSHLISQAITGLALLTLCALVVAGLRLILLFLATFSAVFLPLATAGILSLLLRPVYQFLCQRWKLPSSVAVIVLFALLLVPLTMLVWSFGGLALSQINQLVQNTPEMIAALRAEMAVRAPALRDLLDKVGGEEAIREWLGRNSSAIYSLASGGAQSLFGILGAFGVLLNWAVMPVYLIFFLTAPPFRLEQFRQFLPFLPEETRNDVLFLLSQFVEIVVTFFRGQLSIAMAQGVLMALGFSLCGLNYGFVLGILFGLLNMVPYLGNFIALSIMIPLAALQPGGGLGLVIAVLVVLAVTQAVESYILTPRILGDKTGLHPMAVVFAMFFWGRAIGGVFGLILAIPLTAFLVVFWRLAREKYLPKTDVQM